MKRAEKLNVVLKTMLADQKLRDINPEKVLSFFQGFDEDLLPPHLLVMKAIFLKISESDEDNLTKAEQCLLKALKIDENYYNALIELACLYSIQLETEKANYYFTIALEVAKKNIYEVQSQYAAFITNDHSEKGIVKHVEEIQSKFNDQFEEIIQHT